MQRSGTNLTPASAPNQRLANQTIGPHAVSAVPIAASAVMAGAMRSAMIGTRYEFAESISVLDDRRHLLGTVRLTELLTAAAEQSMEALLRRDCPAVLEDSDREEAASLAIRADAPALAVLDRSGPIGTLVQDVLSLVVYLALAGAIVR